MTDIRVLADTDLPALRRLDDLAFGITSPDSRWEAAAPVLERERQLGAFAATELVGHAGVISHELTVPGGRIPAAGVSWVMVSPLHRRRGVLTALMDRQLADLAESGEAVATLWASEPAIYPRFGYGLASRRMALDVQRVHGTLRDGPADTAQLRLRVGDVSELREACATVYEARRAHRPGMVSRSEAAWVESAYDDASERGGGSALRCVVVEAADGTPQGYAWFRTSPTWDGGSPGGPVEVRELLSDDPTVTRALAGLILDIDLSSHTTLWNLPVDHPLPLLLADPRRARPTLADALWARLIRLDEALQARCYSGPVDLVLEVRDQRCPWNAGRWRLSGDDTGALVEASTAAPDLTLDVTLLAAAYLGDDVLGPAYAAGLVEQRTPGAAVRLQRAMRADRAPWCPYVF